MLRFVSEDMQDGEVAAVYAQGSDVLVMLNRNEPDPQVRCDAVNRLLASAGLPLLAHLSHEMPQAPPEDLLPLVV